MVCGTQNTIWIHWLAVDPLAQIYPFSSPYAFALNTPIQAIDPDGKKVHYLNKAEADKTVASLNSLYKEKYGFDAAFKVVTYEVTIKNPDYGWWDASGLGSDPEYIKQTRHYIQTNNDFDWNKDEYTKAAYDILNATSLDVNVDILADKGTEYREHDFMPDLTTTPNGFFKDYGGGMCLNESRVILSDALPIDKTVMKNGQGDHITSLAGVFLHEVLYHIHPLGETVGQNGNPNKMRDYYGLSHGNDHMADSFNRINNQQLKNEQKTLDAKRATTGKKK